MTGATVKEITGSGITVESGGQRLSIADDMVVLSLGVKSNNALAGQLKDKVKELRVIGDCDAIGKLPQAVRSGYQAGMEV